MQKKKYTKVEKVGTMNGNGMSWERQILRKLKKLDYGWERN
jgi:hypothetical protein